MNISGGWSKSPHFIHEAMRLMSGAEYKCTAVLVRETYGYHRRRVRLTYGDFMQQTGIKGKATISAALKAIEARGFFRRGRSPSEWLVCGPPAMEEQAGGQETGADNGWNGSNLPVMGSSNKIGHSMAGANGREDGSISALEFAAAELNRSICELMQANAEQNCLLTELIRSTAGNGEINEPLGREDGSISGLKGAVGAKNGVGSGSGNEPRNRPKGSECEPLQYYKEKRTPSGKEREGGGSKPLPRARARTQPADQMVRERRLKGQPPKGHLPDRRDRPASHPKVPSPRSVGESDLAAHPAVAVWLDAGLAWPGWERLKVVTSRLGAKPQVKRLQKAREMWLMAGYRMGNIGGILDWYDALCRDVDWQPFVRTRGRAAPVAKDMNSPQSPAMAMLFKMREEIINGQEADDGGLFDHAAVGLSSFGSRAANHQSLPLSAC